MTYLQIIKQMDASKVAEPDHTTSLCNEIDEIDELETGDQGAISSISSISLPIHVENRAVGTLRRWLSTGVLDTLPERIPGFADELTPYADRARLIGMVRAILDAAPWSLTAQERAEQFVAVLRPLLGGEVA